MAAPRTIRVSDPVIRPVQAGDGPRLYEAWQQLRNYYASVDRRIIPAPISREEFVADFERRLLRPDCATFIAAESKHVVGFITGTVELNQPDRLPERHATVGNLFVDAEHRRDGLGRRLFESLATWALAQDGVSHFEMPVLAADDEAVHFWHSIGFTPFILRLWAPLSAPEADA
jgi:GNAT superfamily N-acetyltransferase